MSLRDIDVMKRLVAGLWITFDSCLYFIFHVVHMCSEGKHIVEGLCICCYAIKWIKGDWRCLF